MFVYTPLFYWVPHFSTATIPPHFSTGVYTSRKVIDYMLRGTGVEFRECDREKHVQRLKTLKKKYNPESRDYCGVPVFTDMIKHVGDGNANEYRLGDDYHLKTGNLMSDSQVVLELGLMPLARECLKELGIPYRR